MRSAALCLAVRISIVLVPVTPAEACQSASGCEFWDDLYHEVVV